MQLVFQKQVNMLFSEMKKIDVKIFTQKLLANFTHNYKKH